MELSITKKKKTCYKLKNIKFLSQSKGLLIITLIHKSRTQKQNRNVVRTIIIQNDLKEVRMISFHAMAQHEGKSG